MLDNILLQIAKNAIVNKFDLGSSLDFDAFMRTYPFLGELGASFVTLHSHHKLRGCIGSIVAHRNLIDDIISNAISAAFADPRFAPLGVDELSSLDIEVSVLTKPEVLQYDDFDDLASKVKPNIDGLILNFQNYRGTFLPQVWEQLPNSREFLEHLAYKAGANPSIYDHHPTIYRYGVEAISEKFDAILPLKSR